MHFFNGNEKEKYTFSNALYHRTKAEETTLWGGLLLFGDAEDVTYGVVGGWGLVNSRTTQQGQSHSRSLSIRTGGL